MQKSNEVEAEMLFEIPRNWKWCELKDLLVRASTGPFGSMLHKADYVIGQIPLVNPMNIVDGRIVPSMHMTVAAETKERLSSYVLKTGDIVIGRRGEMGRCAIVTSTEDGWLCGTGSFFLQLQKAVTNDYFALFFSSEFSKKYLNGESVGSTMNNLNHTILNKLPFPLPPLPEQRRIVAKLEELFSKLDAGVAAVRRTQALLKRYRQSVLHAAVTGELTRAWREAHPAPTETGAALLERIRDERRAQWEAAQVAKRGGQLPLGDGWKSKYVEPEAVDTSELHELPEGWTWCRLDSIAEMCLGKMLDEAKNKGTLQPYLRNVSVRWGSFDLEELKLMRFTEEEDERYSVKKGDLVICEGGEPGRAAIWESETPIKIQKALHRVRIKSKSLLNRFLFYSLRHDALGHYLSTYFTGTGIQHFTGAALARYTFPLPPLAEQAEIVAEVERRLTVLDALSRTLTDELKRAERLRQSILHRAFTGRLVPQDATDEPAAALLARLQNESTTPPKARKARASKTSLASKQLSMPL